MVVPMNIRMDAPSADPAIKQSYDVEVVADGDPGIQHDNDDGTLLIPTEDGGVIIDFNPNRKNSDEAAKDHDANLADFIDDAELGRIGGELITGIQTDDMSRNAWLEMRAQGIRLLGLTLNNPRSDVAAGSENVEGMSTIQHPMLLEATLRFQANARGELLPSQGPVKVSSSGLSETMVQDKVAEALENDLNYYLTKIATEYVPDTDRMLFLVGFGGCGFKKVYNCPIRQRPVSESVDASHLIVSDATTDMGNAARITHVIRMKQSTLKRMQIVGAYRDIEIVQPGYQTADAVKQTIADQQGVNPVPQNPADQEFTLYETLCELDITGFEHTKNGKTTGLKLPYRVVIEKDSNTVLEVRRNWQADDEMCLPKNCFVKFPFVAGLGFYDIGLIHILGNTTNAITAAWREMLDAGMFANFPGFLYSKIAGRQLTNQFRVPPGGGVPVETNGKPISESIMPLPYKDISPAFAQWVEQVAQTGARVGGTAEINVSEGKQEAPVGTTLALIEQSTKIVDAVHKRLHAAQAEEFALLKQCFREDPGAFLRSARKKGTVIWDEQKFLTALEDADLVPQADPNTPSHMHRLMKAMAIKQLQAVNPELYDAKAVDTMVLGMIGVKDFQGLFKPPQGAAGPPPEVIKTAIQEAGKQKNAQLNAQTQVLGIAQKAAGQKSTDAVSIAKIKSDERVAELQLAKEMVIHHNEMAMEGIDQLLESEKPDTSEIPGQPPFPT